MIPFEWTFQLRFALALALGFLVGLERESSKAEQKMVFGGVRTHPIISMFGFGCAWLYQIGAGFMLPAGLTALGGLTAIAYLTKARSGHFGSTSEISALLTFVTGALALLVDTWIAMASGVVNAFLLSEKSRLESYVEKLNKVDFLAVLKFLLVTLIILPVLPDEEYTRFHINPAALWKLVILVSTVGFSGYILAKRFGTKVGLRLSGLLGGIISSTAVTVTMARISAKEPERSGGGLEASLLAGAVLYVRVMILVAILNQSYLGLVWWKFLALSAVGVGLAATVRERSKGGHTNETPLPENPFEITPSLIFALLFVLLTVATTLVRNAAGDSGLFVLAGLVGVTDIDPFILSLITVSGAVQQTVVQAILLAMLSNTLFKGIYFGVLVPGRRREAIVRYALWALLHVPLLLAV
jgi:uncharacterized membrane protein (DUF4010 family)